MIAATGSWFGGWSFYLKDGRPVGYEAFSQQPSDQFKVAATDRLPAGPAHLRYDFVSDGGKLGAGGVLTISVNGKALAQGRIERTILISAGLGETFDIGRDTGAPVSEEYSGQGAFAGEIKRVVVDLLPAPGGLGSALSAAKAEAEKRAQ